MKIIDLKQDYKNLYSASAKAPQFVNVPTIQFLTIDDAIEKGFAPGTSPRFKENTQALYGAAYTLKFKFKKRAENPVDYPVMALEGLWWVEDGNFDLNIKDNWFYTLMIMVPELVTHQILAEVVTELRKNKGDLPGLARLRLATINEGKCVQMMHIGPYATEPATVEKMRVYAEANGYQDQIEQGGKHHEVYLGDPRRAAPEKLKTILRHPVKHI